MREDARTILIAAASLWLVALVLFLGEYAPMLVAPRQVERETSPTP